MRPELKMIAIVSQVLIGTTTCAATVAVAHEQAITVCVAPLGNNTGDARHDRLAQALADMLAVSLAEDMNAAVVERRQLLQVLREQGLSVAALVEPATAVRVGRLLGAERIVVGGIAKVQDTLVTSIQAYEITSARLVSTVRAEGREFEIPRLIGELTEGLAKGLNTRLRPVDPHVADKSPAASLHFAKGLGFYFSGNYDRAVVEFMRTQDLAPSLDRPGYWLGLCFMATGEYQHARIEFESLVKRFPASSLCGEAREKMTQCKDLASNRPSATRPAAPRSAERKDDRKAN